MLFVASKQRFSLLVTRFLHYTSIKNSTLERLSFCNFEEVKWLFDFQPLKMVKPVSIGHQMAVIIHAQKTAE